MVYPVANLLVWLQCIVLQVSLVTASPAPAPEPLLSGLTTLVGNIGNAPPPKILWTPKPSPECAVINQGQLQCCRGALAGDQPLVVFLAKLYGYKLNPNNINGVVCELSPSLPPHSRDIRISFPAACEFHADWTWFSGDDELDECPGVKMCCQVTAMVSSCSVEP